MEFNETLIKTLNDEPTGYLPPEFAADLRTAASLYSKGEVDTLLDEKANQDYVDTSLANVNASIALKAPIASPTFTGTVSSPTPATGSNDSTVATTAYVVAKIAATYTAADVLAKLLTVDGAGSGLDADKLGGVAFASYALLASPSFTGNPTVPNQSAGDISTRIANTQHVTDKVDLAFAVNYTPANTLAQIKTVDGAGSGLDTDFFRGLAPSAFATPGDLTAYAPLNSPALTGTPTSPTPTAGDSTTKIATTSFVATSFAPIASPALTGTPTAPTPSTADNTTKIATTAFVQSNIALFPQVTHTWSALQTYSAGVSFGSITAGTPTDLSNHIKLHGSNYGFSVSASQLNYVSNVAHVFYSGTTEVARINSSGNLTLLTALPISEGGTGAETASGARTNLGLAPIASSGSASDLTTGTIADGRLPTSMAGKTFTSDVMVGTGSGVSIHSDGHIEVIRGAGNAYIDLKNSSGEDFDVRLWHTGGSFDVQCTGAGTLQQNGSRVILAGEGSAPISITGLAASASTLRRGDSPSNSMTFSWTGQSGQPAWLWGGNDSVNMYVWNPSNFSVDNAAKLGGVAAASYVKNDGGTYGINITGNANSLGGISAANWLQRADMGQLYADIGHNAIGSVAMLRRTGAGAFIQGDTSIGSQLLYSNADASATGSNPSGTWACQGRCTGGAAGAASVAMWKRIS